MSLPEIEEGGCLRTPGGWLWKVIRVQPNKTIEGFYEINGMCALVDYYGQTKNRKIAFKVKYDGIFLEVPDKLVNHLKCTYLAPEEVELLKLSSLVEGLHDKAN